MDDASNAMILSPEAGNLSIAPIRVDIKSDLQLNTVS